MSTFFGLISIVAMCGTLLALSMMILVSLPQSPLRTMLIQVFGWVFAAFCALDCLSPVDILPEVLFGPLGLPDDLAAAVAGFISARAAWRAGKDKDASSAQSKKPSAQVKAH